MMMQHRTGSCMAEVRGWNDPLASWLGSNTPYLSHCCLLLRCTLKTGPKMTACVLSQMQRNVIS